MASSAEPLPRFTVSPDDPLAAEHAAVSAWVDAVCTSLEPGRYYYREVELNCLPSGMKLLDASGHPLLALAFDSGAGGFLVRVDTSSTLYRMDTWVVDQLTPADSVLKPRKKK